MVPLVYARVPNPVALQFHANLNELPVNYRENNSFQTTLFSKHMAVYPNIFVI